MLASPRSNPQFTVFTPTYNRAHTLEQVYCSLLCQTLSDFEWVIVDDGSSDGTKDQVMSWQSEGKIRIRYFYQENQGKPAAHNRGVREASGELFLVLDSDDACTPNALERFLFHWLSIPMPERDGFSGVTCHCLNPKGNLVGTQFPFDVIDSDPIEMHFKFNVKGEKWGFHRTAILRRFPFPQFPGEKFLPEGLVWHRIAKDYKSRFVNEALRIYSDNQVDRLSVVRTRIRSPQGAMLYYQEVCRWSLPMFHRIKAAINYLRFSLHAGVCMNEAENRRHRTLMVLRPIAYLLYRLDQLRYREGG